MNIPFPLQIFRFFHEIRLWILLPLFAGWLGYGLWLSWKGKRRFFLWLLLFPLILQPLNIALTWCGWHYRMELREQYGKDEYGRLDIGKMPPEIYAEYACHDFHPRARDMKVQGVGIVILLPVLYLAGGTAFLAAKGIRKIRKRLIPPPGTFPP